MVSNTIDQPLNKLSAVKIKLSVPLVASYLSKSYKYVDIAKICNVSRSAVSQYANKHSDELLPLIDNTDAYSAIKAKHIADLAQERLIKHLPQATNKQLVALNMISGVHTDKYRLLSDKSTSNIAVDQLPGRKDERDERKRVLLEELKQVKGDVIDV